MLLIVGIVLLVVGIGDFAIAGLLNRSRATSVPSGLGSPAQPSPVTMILRRSGAVTVLVGAVLIVIALVG